MTFKQHDSRRAPPWEKPDPARAARLHSATNLDRETSPRAGVPPVVGRNGGTGVLVRKNSEKHTSIQWAEGSDRHCPVLTEWRAGGERPEGEDTCPKMLASIRYAYAEGLITLVEGVDPADEQHMVNPLYIAD